MAVQNIWKAEVRLPGAHVRNAHRVTRERLCCGCMGPHECRLMAPTREKSPQRWRSVRAPFHQPLGRPRTHQSRGPPDAGATWTLLGHSERRHTVAHESSDLIAQKTRVALDKGLKVVLCVGELKEERETDQVRAHAPPCRAVVAGAEGRVGHLPLLLSAASLCPPLPPDDEDPAAAALPRDLRPAARGLAEPRRRLRACVGNRHWADCNPRSGAATPPPSAPTAFDRGRLLLLLLHAAPQAQETHKQLREWLASQTSGDVASAVRIVYGGSVKAGNCEDLINQPDIDGAPATRGRGCGILTALPHSGLRAGFLVGGASLKPDFGTIVACGKEL